MNIISKPTAIILAAGQGTRLRPLTNEIPKCMVEVGNKPILNRQLDTLTAAGVEKIIVVTGYRQEKIDDPRITKVYNEEYASTNMIYSLFCAEEHLKGNILICYGDIIYSQKVLAKVLNTKHDITVASDEDWFAYWSERCDDPLDDAETFQKGEDGKVKSLGQKPESKDDVEGQFIGLIKLSPNGCEELHTVYHACKDDQECSENAWGSGRPLANAYMTDIMNYFASMGKLHYQPINRVWFEVDNRRDLAIAEKQKHTLL